MKPSTALRRLPIIALSLLLSVALAAAQGLDEVAGFDKGSVEIGFSKADRETDPVRWLAEAKSGTAFAMSEWERKAILILEDPAAFSEARDKLSGWMEDELENRFAEWIEARFLSGLTRNASAGLNQAAASANMAYLYIPDADGKVQYDAATGDPLIIRPDANGVDANFEADKASWLRSVSGARDGALAGIRSQLEDLAPELLEYLPADRRQTFEAKLSQASERVTGKACATLDALLEQEERLFVARRSGDTYSLRNKSESEAASAIAQELATTTKAECDQRIDALDKQIALADAGTGDLSLAGKDWLDEFQRQLQRGLNDWSDAEERFMVRRAEWERTASAAYTEGEEAWAKAYQRLSDERLSWEASTRRLFDAGSARFENASAELQQNIATARTEMEAQATLRADSIEQRAQAWVSMYAQCGSVLTNARDSVKFWLGEANSSGAPELGAVDANGASTLSAWAYQQLRSKFASAKTRYESATGSTRSDAYRQAQDLQSGIDVLSGYADAMPALWDEWMTLKAMSGRTSEQINRYAALTAQLDQFIGSLNRDYRYGVTTANFADGAALNAFLRGKVAGMQGELETARTRLSQQYPLLAAFDEAATTTEIGRIEALATQCAGYVDSGSLKNYLEIVRWDGMYHDYREKAIAARDALRTDFDLVLGNGTNSLVDILQQGVESGDYCLDEYQVELIRAQAVSNYWAKRAEIAQAVVAYATDLTAGRATDGESLRAWTAASTALSQARLEYQHQVDLLNAQATATHRDDAALAAAKTQLDAAQQALAKLNQEYQGYFSVLTLGGTAQLKDAVYDQYKSLLVEAGYLAPEYGEAPETDAELLAKYMAAAGNYGFSVTLCQASKTLETLVSGTESSASLAVLRKRYDDIATSVSGTTGTLSASNFGIDETESENAGIVAYIAKYNNAQGAGAKAALLPGLQALLTQAKNTAESVVKGREYAIRLVSAMDEATWYREATGTDLATGQTTKEALEADLCRTRIAFLAARAGLEKEALSRAATHAASDSSAASALTAAWTGTAQEAAARSVALASFLASLGTGPGALTEEGVSAYLENIESGLSGDQARWIRDFIRGSGFFADGSSGADLGSAMSATEERAMRLAQERQTVYAQYESTSLATEGRRLAAVRAAVRAAFAEAGIAVQAQDMLADPASVGTWLLTTYHPENGTDNAGTYEAAVAGVFRALDGASGSAPSWVRTEIETYKASLSTYLAARERAAGFTSLSADYESVDAAIAAAGTGLEKIQGALSDLSGAKARTGLISALALEGSAIGSLSDATLEGAIVRSIAYSLYAAALSVPGDYAFGDHTGEYQDELTKLDGATATRILAAAADQAAEYRAVRRATEPGASVDALTGVARKTKIYSLLSGFDASAFADLGADIVNADTKAAYRVRTKLSSMGAYSYSQIIALMADSDSQTTTWVEAIQDADERAQAQTILKSISDLANPLDPNSMNPSWQEIDDTLVSTLTASFGASLASVIGSEADLAAMGEVSGIYKRAAALTVASQLQAGSAFDTDVANAILAMNGIDGLDATDSAWGNANLDLRTEAFAGPGATGIYAQSRAYLLMEAARSGDAAAYNALVAKFGSADPDAAAVLALVQEGYGYLGAYSGSVYEWALAKHPGDTEAALRLARSVQGIFSSDAYTYAASGGIADIGMSDPIIDALRQALSQEMSTRSEALNGQYALRSLRQARSEAAKAAVDSLGDPANTWRAYLTADMMGANADDKRAALAYASGDESETDAAGSFKAASTQTQGALIDARVAIDSSARRVNAAFATWQSMVDATAQAGDADTAESDSHKALREFQADALGYVSGTAPAKDFDIGQRRQEDESAKSLYTAGYSDFAQAQARRIACEAEIGRCGDIFNKAATKAALDTELARLNGLIDTAKAILTARTTDYTNAAATFERDGGQYDAQYEATKNSFASLEAARFEFEKQDAIRRWASTAYLGADDSQNGSAAEAESIASRYQSPAKELSDCQKMLDRSNVALTALRNLYAATQTERPYSNTTFATLYDEYTVSYQRLVATVKARDALSRAIATEQKIYDDLQKQYQKNAIYAAGSNNQYKNAYAAKDSSTSSLCDFLSLSGGNLTIKHDGDWKLTATTQDEWNALNSYFNTKAVDATVKDGIEVSDFQKSIRSFNERMSGRTWNAGSIRQWGLAEDYVRRMLKDKNHNSDSNTYAYKDLGSYAPKISDVLDHMGDPVSTSTVNKLAADFRTHDLLTMQESAYTGLSAADKAELELLVVLQASGLYDKANLDPEVASKYQLFAHQSAICEFEYVEKKINEAINVSQIAQDTALAAAAWNGFQALINVWNPLSGYYTLQEGVCLAVAAGAAWEISQCNDVKKKYAGDYSKIRSTLNAASNNGTVCAVMNSEISLRQQLSASNKRLAKLKGENADGTARQGAMTVDTLTATLSQAAATAGSGLSNADVSAFMGYYQVYYADHKDETAGKDAIDVTSMVAAWAHDAREEARSKVESQKTSDETAQQTAEAAYRKTYDSFMNGVAGVTQAEVNAAANAAFGNALFSKKTYLKKMGAAEDAVAFPDLNDDFGFAPEFMDAGQNLVQIIKEAMEARTEAEMAARQAQWDIQVTDLNAKRDAWQDAVGLILERGRADFTKGFETLQESRTNWEDDFQGAYADKTAQWDQRYLAFQVSRKAWVDEATDAASKKSVGAALAAVGVDAQAFARKMDGYDVSDLSIDAPTASSVVEGILKSQGIGGAVEAFGSLNGATDTLMTDIARGLSGLKAWNSGTVAAQADQFARDTSAELAKRSSLIMARRTKEAVAEAVKQMQDGLKDANDNFAQGMDDTFSSSGYDKQGGNYTKDVVVNSTVANPSIKEFVSVGGYRPLEKTIQIDLDLSETTLAQLDSAGINGVIKSAQKQVEKASKELFGTDAENADETGRKESIVQFNKIQKQVGTHTETGYSEHGDPYTYEVVDYAWVDDTDHPIENAFSWSAGEFGKHIGYSPIMKVSEPGEEIPKTVKDADTKIQGMFIAPSKAPKGELTRLMEYYQYYSMVEGRGMAEMSKAPWEKDIWDDRGSWFQAPSIKTVADVTIGVIATVATAPIGGIGGAMLGAAIGLSDDAVFATLDVAGGYKTAAEAGLDFGKKALVSFGSAAIGSAFSGLGTGLKGLDAVVAKTMVAGAQGVTNTLFSSTVNSLQWKYDDSGNITSLGFNNEAFNQSMVGGLEGVVASMAGSFVSGSMGLLNAQAGKTFGFSDENIRKLNSMNSFVGSAASAAVNYAFTGDLALNVLNIGDFMDMRDVGGNRVTYGLMEMHLGKNGMTMNVGSGGTDVSLGTVGYAMGGAAVWNKNIEIEKAAKRNGMDVQVTLRAQYGFGDKKQQEQLDDILSGKRVLKAGGTTGTAETVKVDGRDVVYLANYCENMIPEQQLAMAVTLGHEAYRDGVKGTSTEQIKETTDAVFGHTGMMLRMANDPTLGKVMESLIASNVGYQKDIGAFQYAMNTGDTTGFIKYVDGNYDSSADYWKLRKDGSIAYDGFATLRDADGNVIRSAAEMGVSENQLETSLCKILGVNPKDKNSVQAVQGMMISAGMQHSYSKDGTNGWTWSGEKQVLIGYCGYAAVTSKRDLTDLNQDKSISLDSINTFYGNMNTDKKTVLSFINNTYGSAIDMLNYAGDKNAVTGQSLLAKSFTFDEVKLVNENRTWLNNALKNGINVDSMVYGNVQRTQEFGVESGVLTLESSTVPNAVYFWEEHTGIDYAGNGTGLHTPGGNWELLLKDSHRATFGLFGSSLKMRIMHLDISKVANLDYKNIYNESSGASIIDYPKASNGSGTGAHVHIDFTSRLPINGGYQRQFVNPATVSPGSRFEYSCWYKDINNSYITGYPSNQYRY